MATEIEIKLGVPDHACMETLMADPQLTEYMQDPFTSHTMRSTYYDTEDGVFGARRWTLRLRDEDGSMIVAMKTPSTTQGAGLYTRREWQCRADSVADAIPRLIDQGAPQELSRLLQGRTLVPTCGAEFTRRTSVLYLPDNVRIEMACDEGRLFSGEREAPICELELELLFGDADALTPVAQRLMDDYHLWEEVESKFQRAYALREQV